MSNERKQNGETAAQAHARHAMAIGRLIDELVEAAGRCGKRFIASGSRDWGYVGTLGMVEERLRELVDALKSVDSGDDLTTLR